MALSKLQIWNLALSRISTRSSISDINENSEEADRIRAVYDHVRDTVLADHTWSFATTYAALAVTGETDALTWEFQYRYPTDCLNAIEIERATTEADPIPFEVSLSGDKTQRVILTNEPDAILKYVVRITNEQLFDNLFIDALAWKIAREIAAPISGDTQRVQMCEQMYQMALSTAKAAKNEEGRLREPRTPDAIRARY